MHVDVKEKCQDIFLIFSSYILKGKKITETRGENSKEWSSYFLYSEMEHIIICVSVVSHPFSIYSESC